MPEVELSKLLKEQSLPVFRQDLKLYPGPYEPDGSPTYSLFDPTRGQFFKISWTDYLIFKHLQPKMTAEKLIEEIEKNSTLKVTPEEIKQFFTDAALNNLLATHRTSEMISKEAETKKQGFSSG